ncbi:MAG: hypothetical protein EOO10_18430 [Chitinophagaceae bacterium]|nr:MAG: hypothetical protein EOO10_18430 [Chitinophagaceae bacterium]
MTIRIQNKQSNEGDEYTYLATFPLRRFPALKTGPYPVTLNPTNAEGMLHAINALCYHPQFGRHVRQGIPSAFYPARTIPGRHLPLEALLGYFAGPYNIRSLDWADPATYTKVYDGLCVGFYDNDFLFPEKASFTKNFIRSYGRPQWDHLNSNEPLTDFLFVNEADNNVAAMLAPVETFFIREKAYFALCRSLRELCLDLQILFHSKLFRWDSDLQSTPWLISFLKEKSVFFS